jgi:hypothetical protein
VGSSVGANALIGRKFESLNPALARTSMEFVYG